MSYSSNAQKEYMNNTNVNGSTVYDRGCGSTGGGKWASLIKQKILEYEGPNFNYKPIFSAPAASEVS